MILDPVKLRGARDDACIDRRIAMRATLIVPLLSCLAATDARKRRGSSDEPPTVIEGTDIVLPSEWGPRKRKEIMEAVKAEAHERENRRKRGLPMLPLFPSHTIACAGRPGNRCRPGEGNMKHSMEGTGEKQRFKQWTQPYEHREAYVQSRSRNPPHQPDAEHYGELVKVAKSVATDNLVLVTSGDYDYRGLVWNWLQHAKALKHLPSLCANTRGQRAMKQMKISGGIIILYSPSCLTKISSALYCFTLVGMLYLPPLRSSTPPNKAVSCTFGYRSNSMPRITRKK